MFHVVFLCMHDTWKTRYNNSSSEDEKLRHHRKKEVFRHVSTINICMDIWMDMLLVYPYELYVTNVNLEGAELLFGD